MKSIPLPLLIVIYCVDGIIAWSYYYNRIPVDLPHYGRQYELLSAVLVGVFWPVYLAGKVAIYITAP